MIWGRPKVDISFETRDLANGRIIECGIRNSAVTSAILQYLGVRRVTAENVMASYFVKDPREQKLIFPKAAPRVVSFKGAATYHVNLPATSSVSFGIAGVATEEGKVRLVADDTKLVLAPGAYSACVDVTVEGKHVYREQNFVVIETLPFVYWDISGPGAANPMAERVPS